MRHLIFTLSIFALFILKSNTVNSEYAEVSFQLLDHKPVVHVMLNGRPATFLLDTGSDLTLIDASVAKKFNFELHNLPGNRGKVSGIGGQTQKIQLATGVDMKLGGRKIFTTYVGTQLSASNTYFKTSGKAPLIGIIGADVMQMYGFVIDYEENRLIMGTPGVGMSEQLAKN